MIDATIAQELAPSTSSYKPYPINKPFINSNWVKQNAAISKGFPESNRDVIINTLKSLQQKLNKLESSNRNDSKQAAQNTVSALRNRQSADVNDSNLYTAYPITPQHSNDCSNNNKPYSSSKNYTNINNSAPPLNDDAEYFNDGYKITDLAGISNHQANHLSNIDVLNQKSINTEKRVIELEKQLERMRSLLNEVTSNDIDEKHFQQQQQLQQQQFNQQQSNDYVIERSSLITDPARNNLEYDSSNLIEIDQQMYLRESDGFHLPIYSEKVVNRKKSKKVVPKRKKTIETLQAKQTNETTIGNGYVNVLIPCRSKSVELCSRAKNMVKPVQSTIQFNSQNHYKLNWSDIPFVVGQSTTPSHRVGTNLQNVISMLKMHHPRLCGSVCGPVHATQPHPTHLVVSKSLNNNSDISANSPAPAVIKRNSSLKISGVDSLLRNNHQNNNVNTISSSVNLVRSNSNIESKNDTHHISTQTTAATTAAIVQNSNMNSNLNLSNTTSTIHNTSTSVNMSEPEWNELLRSMQEEYTNLVLQHYDLTKKIVSCSDINTRKGFEVQADLVHKKMKTKIKQINKLKSYASGNQAKNLDESIMQQEQQEHIANLKKQAQQQSELERQFQQKLQQQQQLLQLQQKQQLLQDQKQIQLQQKFQQQQHQHQQHNQVFQHSNETGIFDNVLTESKSINSYSNIRNMNNLFSGNNSANTSYMTLNENLYKSTSNYNQTVVNPLSNKSLKLLKNIRNLQSKIQNDELMF